MGRGLFLSRQSGRGGWDLESRGDGVCSPTPRRLGGLQRALPREGAPQGWGGGGGDPPRGCPAPSAWRPRGRGRKPPPALRRPYGLLPARARPPRRPGVGASRSARRFSDCIEALRLLGRFLLRPPPVLDNRYWTAPPPLQRLGGMPLVERDVIQGREQALRMAIGSRAFATERCTAHFDLGTHWRRGIRGDWPVPVALLIYWMDGLPIDARHASSAGRGGVRTQLREFTRRGELPPIGFIG